ncbi:hypothetical protein CQ395_17195 [Clostridium neonatale]|nr:hypothetical protein [Clostridium neonatale]MDU4849409.1 hypothetical protein [Clostridium sp.]PEG25605.1 hypothetical protein CQ395_17195 [Clostridium neonatale]
MDEKMRKIILSGFIVILSLSLISCNNSSDKEAAESNKSTRKDLKTYFITTSKEENTASNWVFGESNENPLEEKENTNKRENVVTGNNKNKPAENNMAASKPQNTTTNSNTNNSSTTTNNNNNSSPDPNYNMNDIIPGPDDETFNPIDSSANPNDIVSDPYANEEEDSSDDENGYKEAEDRTFGNEPD